MQNIQAKAARVGLANDLIHRAAGIMTKPHRVSGSGGIFVRPELGDISVVDIYQDIEMKETI